MPAQSLFPGFLENAYHREYQKLIAGSVVTRLWAKDASLRPIEELRAGSIPADVGWLDLPEQMGPYVARVKERVARIEAEGIEDLVFVSLGGSNLAA
jgi:glucose-6-phosphate isomerase